MVIATVPKLWPDSTIVCLGTGPSLTVEDVNAVRGHSRVIAVNDAYRLAPWADVLYACDAKWWRWHKGVPSFQGLKYALEHRDIHWLGVQLLKKTGREGLERDPSGLRTGHNSGYQAINLAVHLGARRIVLLGYDMGHGPNKPTHFFGDHPHAIRTVSDYQTFARHFALLVEPLRAAGVEIVNCSRRTALTCFPRQSLEQALPERLEMAG